MGKLEKYEIFLLQIGDCFEYAGSSYIILEDTTITRTQAPQPELAYLCQDEAGLHKKFIACLMVVPITQTKFTQAEEDYNNDNADMIRLNRSPRIDVPRMMRGGPNRWR